MKTFNERYCETGVNTSHEVPMDPTDYVHKSRHFIFSKNYAHFLSLLNSRNQAVAGSWLMSEPVQTDGSR